MFHHCRHRHHRAAVTNPLHATYCADRAFWETVEVVENVQLARDTYRVRFACPPMARRFLPGQFLMLRLAGSNDPLLGRAFALYDTVHDRHDGLQPPQGNAPAWGIDVVYLVVGKLTGKLAEYRPGQRLEVWGPLGNGFSPAPIEHLIMVAGGIGQTPFLALAREFLGHRQYGDPPRTITPCRRVTFCYGARSAEYLAGVDDFTALGVEVRLATDDGTRGRRGFITDVLREVLATNDAPARIACCGPERMMAAVAQMATAAQVPCEVSLETPMACGLGICFSCVTKVHLPTGGWDYKRTCVEGPVFDAARIAW